MVFDYKKDITDYSSRDQFAHVIDDVFRIIGEESDLEKPEQSNRERDFDTHSYFESGLQIPTRQNMPARRPPVSADTRPLPKLDFSAILARTIKPRAGDKNPFFSLMAQSKKNKVKRVSFSFLEISKTHLPNCRRRGANMTSEYGHLHLTTCKNYLSEKEMEKQEFHIRAEYIESNGTFSSDPAQFYTSPATQFEVPPLPTSLTTVPGVMNKKSCTTDSLPYHDKNSPGLKTPENSVFHKPAPELSFPQTALDLRNEVVVPIEETPSTSSRTESPPHELALHMDEQPTSSRASSVFSGDLDDDIMALLDDSDSEGEEEEEEDSSTKESSASSEEDCAVELKSVVESDNRTKHISIEVIQPETSPVKSLPPPTSNSILLGPIVNTRTSFSDSGYGEEEEEEEEKSPIITLSSRRRGAKKVKTWFENSTTPPTTETTETSSVTPGNTAEEPMEVGFVNPFTRATVTTATVVKDAPSVVGGLVSRAVVATEPELTLPQHDPTIQEKFFKFDTPSRDDIVREAQGVLTK